jgi:hypothetical protein
MDPIGKNFLGDTEHNYTYPPFCFSPRVMFPTGFSGFSAITQGQPSIDRIR